MGSVLDLVLDGNTGAAITSIGVLESDVFVEPDGVDLLP